MKNKQGLIFGLLTIVVTSPAMAANWEGFYTGVNAGNRDVETDWEIETVTADDGFIDPITGQNSLDDDALSTGVFAGFNRLLSDKVLIGAELSVSYADTSDNVSQIEFNDPADTDGLLPDPDTSLKIRSDWEVSILGRVGYLLTPKTLFYVNGGLSALRQKVSMTCRSDNRVCDGAAASVSGSESHTITGWTAGLGLEAELTANLTARVEYRYTDYGDESYKVLSPSINSYGIEGDVDTSVDTLSIGLAYHF